MITIEQAKALKHGDVLLHVAAINGDSTPVRCRVTGAVKTWKTRPGEFRVPVKQGLKNSFYISSCDAEINGLVHGRNNDMWCLAKLWEVETTLKVVA